MSLSEQGRDSSLSANHVELGESSKYHQPASADEVTGQNVRTIAELEESAKSAATMGERIAERVAGICGSATFIWIHVAWFGTWIFLNTSPMFASHPDPFPFTFLTLVVSLEAIFLSSFILISQNQETRLAERRSHLDLQINLLTEQENTKMLRMLESIAKVVGAPIDDPPNLAVLEESTRPERVLDQIDEARDSEKQDRHA